MWFCEWRRCCANRHLWRFLLSRKVIQGIVTFIGKHNNKVVSNLPDSVSEWKMRFFYACLKEAGGGGLSLFGESIGRRGNRVGGARDELESGSAVLPFSQPQIVLTKGDLLPVVSGLDVLWCSASFRARRGGGNRRARRGVLGRRGVRRRGPVIPQDEEEERLARREVADLHTVLALSREEARRSGLTFSPAEPTNSRPAKLVHSRPAKLIYSRPMEPIDSMPTESVHVVDVEGDFASPIGRQRTTMVRGFLKSQHKGHDKASRRPRGIQNSCRNMAATSTLVHRGVLGVTLGETSWCSANEEIFRCPFDIEARALKILSDLLPSRAEETLVGLLKDLDAAKFEQELAKETTVKLLAKMDAAKAERDEALDDANGGILAKRDLEQALEEATTKVTNLSLQKLNTEVSICRLSDKGDRAREEASKLSSELDLEESQTDIVRLQAELEAPWAEPAQLRADSSEEAEGDASGQAS
ncbi:hypothetical protein ACLOJK_028866 [Asimina triloba]